MIQFIDPITGEGTPDAKPQYDPVNAPTDFSRIPDERGVYIWGMKVRVGSANHFAPWCVGESERLRNRLFKDHYGKLCSSGNHNEELFDFSRATYSAQDLVDLYVSMKQYDDTVNQSRSGIAKLQNALLVDKLIYWQNALFFYSKCNIPYPGGVNRMNRSHQQAVCASGLLDSLKTADAALIKKKILDCKRSFDHRFYFIYCVLKGGEKLEQPEHSTKQALRQIGIFTTAKGQGGYPRFQINLPISTPFVHDLWGPGMSVRTLIEGPRP
ncbi:MAG: hypothetical protein IPL86_11545 [Flavobacteriales bacterium]|nr:hypothetical protein [Flavobacteriales bacterium]